MNEMSDSWGSPVRREREGEQEKFVPIIEKDFRRAVDDMRAAAAEAPERVNEIDVGAVVQKLDPQGLMPSALREEVKAQIEAGLDVEHGVDGMSTEELDELWKDVWDSITQAQREALGAP